MIGPGSDKNTDPPCIDESTSEVNLFVQLVKKPGGRSLIVRGVGRATQELRYGCCKCAGQFRQNKDGSETVPWTVFVNCNLTFIAVIIVIIVVTCPPSS